MVESISGDWLPVDFVPPKRLQVTGQTHLRPIRVSDVDVDMAAVLGSRERLWSIFGAAWAWPPVTLTREQDIEDLSHHVAEMQSRESFNYGFFCGDESQLLVCVYIDPAKPGADADVCWWVVDRIVD